MQFLQEKHPKTPKFSGITLNNSPVARVGSESFILPKIRCELSSLKKKRSSSLFSSKKTLISLTHQGAELAILTGDLHNKRSKGEILFVTSHGQVDPRRNDLFVSLETKISSYLNNLIQISSSTIVDSFDFDFGCFGLAAKPRIKNSKYNNINTNNKFNNYNSNYSTNKFNNHNYNLNNKFNNYTKYKNNKFNYKNNYYNTTSNHSN